MPMEASAHAMFLWLDQMLRMRILGIGCTLQGVSDGVAREAKGAEEANQGSQVEGL